MSRNAWITPQNPAPTALRCRRIYIPDDLEWKMAVTGALIELTKAHNWSDITGGQSPDYVASTFGDIFDRFAADDCMIGVIFIHAASQAPDNSLPCDGATYNRADYPDLYDHLDAAYRLGSTQFKTPDLRGRVVLGDGQGVGLTNRAFTTIGGAETVTLTQAQMPSHTHGDFGHSHGESQAVPAVGAAITGVPVPSAVPGAGLTANSFANLSNTGGGGFHGNMQPWIALRYAIWAK